MVKADHLTPGLLVTEAGTFPAPAWRRAPRPQSQRILEPLTEREGVKLWAPSPPSPRPMARSAFGRSGDRRRPDRAFRGRCICASCASA